DLERRSRDKNTRPGEFTPLGLAVAQPKAVAWLLRHGADPLNPADNTGRLAWRQAIDNVQYGDREKALPVVVAFVENCTAEQLTRMAALHDVARLDLAEAVPLLLKRGVKVDAADAEGRTPLHTAVEHQKPAMVTLLLKQEADP